MPCAIDAHTHTLGISTNITAYIELIELTYYGPGHGEKDGEMEHIRNGVVLPRRSLASTPDPTSCLDVANVPIHVLS